MSLCPENRNSEQGRNTEPNIKDYRNEAYFSAKSPQASAQARFPRPDVNQGRAGNHKGPQIKGKKTPVCLRADRISPPDIQPLEAIAMCDVARDEKTTAPSSGTAFSRYNKLNKAVEFKRVFRKPLVSSDVCFKVLARSGNASTSRLGMAVSRNVDKRAVGRNRIKRVIRESFRSHYTAEKARLDIVVLPRRNAATMCNTRLYHSLQRHWSRLDNQLEG